MTPTDSAKTSTKPGTYEYQLRTFGNEHVAFSFRLGPGESVDAPATNASGTVAATDPFLLGLSRDGDKVADFTAHPASGPAPYPNTDLGNGRYGIYRTTADIPPDESAAAAHVPTAIGDAVVFTHPYFECTNSCQHWSVPVAVVTLAHPKDPAFPTLVVASNHAALDIAGVESILGRLTSP